MNSLHFAGPEGNLTKVVQSSQADEDQETGCEDTQIPEPRSDGSSEKKKMRRPAALVLLEYTEEDEFFFAEAETCVTVMIGDYRVNLRVANTTLAFAEDEHA